MNTTQPEPIARFEEGRGPLVAVAVHDGHALREDVAGLVALTPAERLREEDPYTGAWTRIAPTRVVGTHSRFQVDLNRPRAAAVYRVPADAWGLEVWKAPPPQEMVQRSLEGYDAFYTRMGRMLDGLAEAHGMFIVLDLHTYNHRRAGPEGEPADPGANPEVNVGTGTMDRALWAPIVDRFMADLSAADFLGRRLDVRENVKFKGGALSRWIHARYPGRGCSLAVEFKKFFMDEWTGRLDELQHQAIDAALRATVPGLLQAWEEKGGTSRQ